MKDPKPNMLVILPWFPYPLNSGGDQAMFNGILAMQDDFDLSIAYEAENNDENLRSKEAFLQLCPQVHLYPLLPQPLQRKTLKKRFVSKLKTLLKKVFYANDNQMNNDSTKEDSICLSWIKNVLPPERKWYDHLNGILSEKRFDIIQVEMMQMLSMITLLPASAKKVFVHHEIGFVRRAMEAGKAPTSSFLDAYRTFADYNEIALLNMYDMIITLSPVDAEKLKKGGVTTSIMPSFAVVDSSLDFSVSQSDGTKLVFVGPDCHEPNVIGVKWFLENCWKKLKQIDPSYSLNVIGRWNQQNVSELQEKYRDVVFSGFVDDLKGAIRGSIMIVPVTIGSGIRMKILEAATIGVPFVSTSVGAEGIPVVNGVHCFLADDPDVFVEDLVKLKDPELQRSFIVNAKDLINNQFSFDGFKRNRMRIYDSLLRN